jgi:alcohol dehydrogenase class IV
MPAVLAFNADSIRERFDMAAAYLGIDGGFDGFRAFVQTLNDQLGIPRTLSEIGATSERIDDLAEMAIRDPSCGGNPVALTVEDLRALFRQCM